MAEPIASQALLALRDQIDGLDKLLAAPAMDETATLAAAQDLNRSCTDCHRIYRSMDEDGHFILKPGSVPGY